MEKEKDILNLEEACALLKVSERTLIKLLQEEHLPARKIGREWRFSRQAILNWLALGDSYDYSIQNEPFAVYEDNKADCLEDVLTELARKFSILKETNDLKEIIEGLNQVVSIPEKLKLSVSYKQKRDIEQLEFKLFWPLRYGSN